MGGCRQHAQKLIANRFCLKGANELIVMNELYWQQTDNSENKWTKNRREHTKKRKAVKYLLHLSAQGNLRQRRFDYWWRTMWVQLVCTQISKCLSLNIWLTLMERDLYPIILCSWIPACFQTNRNDAEKSLIRRWEFLNQKELVLLRKTKSHTNFKGWRLNLTLNIIYILFSHNWAICRNQCYYEPVNEIEMHVWSSQSRCSADFI